MQIDEGVAYDEPFETATASLRFEGQGVRLDGIETRKAGGQMTGAAYVGWEGTYSFNFSGRRVPVESVYAMTFPQAPLTGQLDFTAAGSGLFESPQYNVRMSVSDLFVKDEGIGDVTARLTIRDNTLGVEMDAASPRLIVTGTGRISMTDEYDAELTFRFTDTSLDPYVRTFQPELSPFTTAVASGTVRVTGELTNPQHLRVDARADVLTLRLFDYVVRNDGPLRVTYEQEVVRLDQFRLVGDGTRLDVGGTVDLGAQQIAIRSTGDANLGILQGFLRDLRSSGQADLVADISGPLANPVFSGRASIAGGRIRHFSLPHALEAVNGRVTFDARRPAAGRGDGPAGRRARALRRSHQPGRLSALAEFNLTATGEDMRLRYPEGFRSVIDADLSLRGAFEAPVLGRHGDGEELGVVAARRGLWQLSSSLPDARRRWARARRRRSFPLRFDVRLIAPSTLRIDNNLARIVSSADLALRGTYDKPLVFGRAEIERGEVTFEGKRYVVTRGTIDFSNPNQIEPFFDVEAETRVRVPGQNYTVTLNAVGTFTRFQWGAQLRPAAADGGRAGDAAQRHRADRSGAGGAAATRRGRAAVAAGSRGATAGQPDLVRALAGVVEQTFGIDTFQITPSLTDPTAQSSRLIPGARLTIGKRISNRVYLTFSQSLSASSTTRDQVILLEYDQSDRLSWVLSQNEDRTYALDMRVRYVF